MSNNDNLQYYSAMEGNSVEVFIVLSDVHVGVYIQWCTLYVHVAGYIESTPLYVHVAGYIVDCPYVAYIVDCPYVGYIVSVKYKINNYSVRSTI